LSEITIIKRIDNLTGRRFKCPTPPIPTVRGRIRKAKMRRIDSFLVAFYAEIILLCGEKTVS
jgi:hypothetical protein